MIPFPYVEPDGSFAERPCRGQRHPQAWLADVLSRIADTPQNRLHELLPWNWQASSADKLKAA